MVSILRHCSQVGGCFQTMNLEDELRNMTLLDLLVFVLPEDSKLPKTQYVANAFWYTICKKFLACTEDERRTIARSDLEFVSIMRRTIMKRCGFKDEIEAYGQKVDFDVPKIPRKNELLWSTEADPEEEQDPEYAKINSGFSKLVSEVFIAMKEFYPNDLQKAFPDREAQGVMAINTSHTQLIKEMQYAVRHDFKKFVDIALKHVVAAIMMQVEEKTQVSKSQRDEMTKVIQDAVRKNLGVR